MFKRLNKIGKIMLIVFLVFLVWMLFFDENSYLTHRQLDKELNKLKTTNAYFKKEIEKDKKMTEDLKNPILLEKFAREEYKMKKAKEDVFLIEFDTIKE